MHEVLHLTRAEGAAPDGLPSGPLGYRRLERREVVAEAELAWGEGLYAALARQASNAKDADREALGELQWRFLQRLRWEAQDRLLVERGEGEEALLTFVSDAEELYGLPWELTWSGRRGDPLHALDGVLVRYELAGLDDAPLRSAPKAPGVLFAWASTVPLSLVGAHRAELEEACGAGGLALHEVEHVSLSALRDALDEGGFSALHVLCHGEQGRGGAASALLFGEQGEEERVTPRRLKRLLRGRPELRLLTLMACNSGAVAGPGWRSAGLAGAAQEAGVPSVLASRWLLGQRASIRVTRALYQGLCANGLSLERALPAARGELLDDGFENDATTLQLFARSEETRLDWCGARERREVVASYPFGDSLQPTPKHSAGRSRVELLLEGTLAELGPEGERALLQVLIDRSRDRGLKIVGLAEGSIRVVMETHQDGWQSLQNDHRAGQLALALGRKVLGLAGVSLGLAGIAAAAEAAASAGEAAASAGEVAASATERASAASGAGAATSSAASTAATSAAVGVTAGGVAGGGGAGTAAAGGLFAKALPWLLGGALLGGGGALTVVGADIDADGDGYVASVDCDDDDPGVHPGAEETCDALDQDCDRVVDEHPTDAPGWLADLDGDGFGAGVERFACEQVCDHVPSDGAELDCDDRDGARFPDAQELCDQLDNDCDREVDEEVEELEWFEDKDGDGDGYRAGDGQLEGPKACAPPGPGWVLTATDCDEDDPAMAGTLEEICDGVDNDCDISIDEGDIGFTWYRDDDGDGYGQNGDSVTSCERPEGYVRQGDDCDDTSGWIRPKGLDRTGNAECCGSPNKDDDCDGRIDEGPHQCDCA